MLKQYAICKQRLTRMHRLLKTRSTGNRNEFAKKLDISESQLSNYLQYIREQGVNVSYDYYQRCYYYNEEREITYQCGFQRTG